VRQSIATCAALVLMAFCADSVGAVTLRLETLHSFEEYVRRAEARIEDESRHGRFLSIDALVGDQRARVVGTLRRGEVVVNRLDVSDRGSYLDIPSGMVHHWLGIVFIGGARLADVVALAEDYDRHAEVFQPAVARSKLRRREGDMFDVYFRFVQKRIITVVLDVDSDARFRTVDASRVEGRVYSKRIAEVENAGEPDERVGTPDDGHGYLWRLYTYCRFQQVDDGVYVEFETISLTRDVPFGLGWVIRPFITSVPRESLVFTLETYVNVLRRIGQR